jgi:RNA polymerase sigma factor (sigma-70 family)
MTPKVPLRPDEASIAFGYVDTIRDALTALPERERLCLTLVRFEYLSAQEVAKRLRITPDAVRMNVHRARARLRQWLHEDNEQRG